MKITINGRKVSEVNSIQRFYNYNTSPPKVIAVYIEGRWENGDTFYCKSDVDNVEVVIDGEIISQDSI